MPTACGAPVKYMWIDHDTAFVNEFPPVLNQWYTVFDEVDVRLLWFVVYQSNDEVAAKDVEIRWTIDGTVYFMLCGVQNNLFNYIYRYHFGSFGGTDGLNAADARTNATFYVDKRGHSFKAEVRIISALGTNQLLRAFAVYETLEQVAP